MNDEFERLRPEVVEAVEYCDDIFNDADNGEWATIRAELLRLNSYVRQAVLQYKQLGSEYKAVLDRAKTAEAELLALEAMIFQGIVLDVDDLARGHAGLPSEWRGKRVRLVVEE